MGRTSPARKAQVAELRVQGLTQWQVSEQLNMDIKTVKKYDPYSKGKLYPPEREARIGGSSSWIDPAEEIQMLGEGLSLLKEERSMIYAKLSELEERLRRVEKKLLHSSP